MTTLAFLLGLIAAADSPKEADAGKELQKWQGTWAMVTAVRDGKEMPQEEVKKFKLTIQAKKFILEKDSVVISEGTLSFDQTKKPKEIEETVTAGPNKGKVFLAIYEIDDDHHKICFAGPRGKRPTEFSSTPGSGQLLQEWKRGKR